MSIKLTHETTVATLEQFDGILQSYTTQNAIWGVCSPMYYEAKCIVENMRDYFTFERNIGISRIRFRWKNIFTDHKLEYTDFTCILDMISRFFPKQRVIYSLLRNNEDFVIEFLIHPEHIKGHAVTPVDHEMMQYLARIVNAYADISDDVVYCDPAISPSH